MTSGAFFEPATLLPAIRPRAIRPLVLTLALFIALHAAACSDTVSPTFGQAASPAGPGRLPPAGIAPLLACTADPDCADVAAGEACLEGWCGDDGLCRQRWRPDGTACDDGNTCTEADICLSGLCTSGASACVCEADADCVPFDLNVCDGPLLCAGGTCLASEGQAIACPPPGEACRTVQCEPTTGACIVGEASDGTPCPGTGPCGGAGACVAGACLAPIEACDDGDPCTEDICDPVKGCGHVPGAGPCDDGDACTTEDSCQGGTCVGGPGVVCPPDTPCVTYVCDPSVGCEPELAGPEVTCSDGDPCTTMDHCQAGGDCAGTPLICDDGDPCTDDSCGDQGCEFAPVPGCGTPAVPCDPDAPGTACDDGDPATVGDLCVEGKCRGFAEHLVQGTAPGAEVALRRVSHHASRWFLAADVTTAGIGAGGVIVSADDWSGDGTIHDETLQPTRFNALHGGFALDADGDLWEYLPDSSAGTWTTLTALPAELAASGAGIPAAVWTAQADGGKRHLWIVGHTAGGQPYLRHCFEALSGLPLLDVECFAQSLGSADALVGLPRAVAGHAGCLGVGCVAHLALGADVMVTSGGAGATYYNDTYGNDSGFAPSWGAGFVDPGAAPSVTRDIAPLGGLRYLVVGTWGYLRYRSGLGGWSNALSFGSSLQERDFEGAWSGAGVVVVAGSRAEAGGGRALELWTAAAGADLTWAGAWTVSSLGSATGAAAGLYDVWGLEDGTIVAVGAHDDVGLVWVRR